MQDIKKVLRKIKSRRLTNNSPLYASKVRRTIRNPNTNSILELKNDANSSNDGILFTNNQDENDENLITDIAEQSLRISLDIN